MKDALGKRLHLYQPYLIMFVFCFGLAALAFFADTPGDIFGGFWRILTSRSILVTDYIALGGIGATMLNASIVGTVSLLMLMFTGVKPNGATTMAIWMTIGFAFFGKNLFNMVPLTFGVWLYARYSKEPFINYYLAALLVATLSPAVSEISFMGIYNHPAEIVIGILFGLFIGFIFPSLSAFAVRLHNGYNLYNMGFAGGLVCTVIISWFTSLGIDIVQAQDISSGNNPLLAAVLYLISAILLCCGLFLGDRQENLHNFKMIWRRSGRLVSDFYLEHGNAIYINAAVLCAFATTLVLAFGAELNGPTIAGIFTITGFGSFGKHLKNVLPIVIGAVLSVYFNRWDISLPNHMVTVLFSTGLAPVAGQYGWIWGMVAGFLHVPIAVHTSYLCGGLNLYANGFAAGFVVMFLLPLITAFGKEKGQ